MRIYNRVQVEDLSRRPRTAALTLGELLAMPGLGLALLSGFETAAQAPVAGAHSIEIEHPSQWLDEDWIMLTTGVRLRGSAQAQRELIDELTDAGCCALGLGVGVGFARVPSALVSQAQARGFPLFCVPLPTPFRAIVSAVQRALISAEIRGGVPARASEPGRAHAAQAVEAASHRDTRQGREVLHALRSRLHLHETLAAYLDNELDVVRTAGAMGVHPNTLRYRIKRIEELAGGSLRRPQLLAELHFALQEERVGS